VDIKVGPWWLKWDYAIKLHLLLERGAASTYISSVVGDEVLLLRNTRQRQLQIISIVASNTCKELIVLFSVKASLRAGDITRLT
jgi:hypothetical protein